MEFIDSYRQVIPRWTLFEHSFESLPLTAAARKPKTDGLLSVELDKLSRDWSTNKSLPFALDLLGAALLTESPRTQEISKAAHYVCKKLDSSDVRSEIARYVLTGELANSSARVSYFERANAIQSLRRRLKLFPRDPITWIDLGFNFALLGNWRNAHRCVRAALSAGSSHPFILRSAARFFIHSDDPVHGLKVLRESNNARISPWILSADIAICDAFGLPPRKIKAAREILSSGRFPASALSELSSALGTLELGSGASKKARRLFSDSLIDPTENSLAQAVWALNKGLHFDFAFNSSANQNAHEAGARDSIAKQRHKVALQKCEAWQGFQPLSARPAIFGSYVAGVFLDDHESALRIVNAALPASENRFALHNNKAFSLACLGRLSEANGEIKKADALGGGKEETAALTATKGLIAFRHGEIEQGREFYRNAFYQLKSAKGKLGLLCYNWLREEINAGTLKLQETGLEELEASSEESLDKFVKASSKLLSL